MKNPQSSGRKVSEEAEKMKKVQRKGRKGGCGGSSGGAGRGEEERRKKDWQKE